MKYMYTTPIIHLLLIYIFPSPIKCSWITAAFWFYLTCSMVSDIHALIDDPAYSLLQGSQMDSSWVREMIFLNV